VTEEVAMDKLIVLIALLGSLFGCDGGRDEVVHRIVVSGHDVLLSRASLRDGKARLDCLRSDSGRCHYIVLPRGCDADAPCSARATRYDVPAGASRRVAGLRGIRLCVAGGAQDAPQCTSTDGLGG
jgi:hypothetical protein